MIPLRKVDFNDESLVLVLGYSHYDFFKNDIAFPSFMGHFINADCLTLMDRSGKGAYLNYEYYIENQTNFQQVADMFADEESVRVLEAFLNQRINGKIGFLDYVRGNKQYYDLDAIDFKKIKGFVDCGAYDGDSYRSFLEEYKHHTQDEFTGKAWLWEPESANIEKLQAGLVNDNRVVIVPKGASDENGKLCFSGNGTAGACVESGDDFIEVATIDSTVNSEIDFIKMDIEGSEYNALLGAKESIQRYNPILAICVYHRRDDLFRIPQLIRSMNAKYKLYLRIYQRHSSELVLYAVP